MKNKSLFAKILKYFLATMILPFLAFLLLYGYAANTLEEQITLSSESMLTQFFALVDNVMEDYSQTCITVGSENVCIQHIAGNLSSPNSSKYSGIMVRNMLKKYQDEKIFDVMVYFPKLDQVISQRNGVLTSEEYLLSTYGRGEFQAERYSPLLNCKSPTPQLSAFFGADQQKYLCMNMRWTTIGSPESEYVVGVVFSPSYLESLMIQEQLGEDGTLIIYDANKELLISGDGVSTYELSDSVDTEALFESKNENGNYVILSRPSNAVDGYYAYATDVDDFWKALSALRVACLVACGMCLVLTVVLVFWGTKKVYSPIDTAVQRAVQVGAESYDRNEHNEMEFIANVLEKSNTERSNLESRIRKNQSLRYDEFVRAVLKGEAELKDSNQNILEGIGMTDITGRYRVLLVYIRHSADMDAELLDFVISNTFEEISGINGCGYVVNLTGKQYALLVHYNQDGDPETQMESFIGCQTCLRQNLGLDLVLSSGGVCRGLKDAHKSFVEAEWAMKYMYLMEDTDYIDYKEIKNREFSYSSTTESTLSRNIVGFINGKNPELSGEAFVEKIIKMCNISDEVSMDNIECFKYEMISIINKAFMICGATENRKERIQELVLQPTISAFQRDLAELLETLRQMKQYVSKQETICQKVMEYITENYADPQFSLTHLGDMLNLSPYYVSRLFKDKYEMTISDCIAKTRIQKAKEQLINTNYSIKIIAEKNGFLSSNIFIRTFKKWEGVTPGFYRAQEK